MNVSEYTDAEDLAEEHEQSNVNDEEGSIIDEKIIVIASTHISDEEFRRSRSGDNARVDPAQSDNRWREDPHSSPKRI